jgi:hypothetical protein
MAKQRPDAPVNAAPPKRKAGGKSGGAPKTRNARPGGAKPSDTEPEDPATLLQAGNRPHETTLHGTELEDFGLDVLPVIQPRKA